MQCLSILAGVLCRHVLRIFFMVRVRYLSEEYIMKRWAMDSAGSIVVNQPLEPGISPPECLAVWLFGTMIFVRLVQGCASEGIC